ncbi:MAG: PilW family protein [Pseudolysinimonas sp.]
MSRTIRLFRKNSRQHGFTLIEGMVTLFITVLIIVAMLALFDFTNKLTRVQTQVADMQQELRVSQSELARFARMAGRGGLPLTLPNRQLPTGLAFSARDQVPVNEFIAPGDNTTPAVVAGTDVMTLRGVFSGSIYQINYDDPTQFVLRDGAAANVTKQPQIAVSGAVQICATTAGGIPQNLAALRTLIASATPIPEAMILTSALGDAIFGVVAFDPAASLPTSANCNTADTSQGVTLAFKVGTTGATNREDVYRSLSPAFNTFDPVSGAANRLMPTLTSVAFIGIIEEYRYYIRNDGVTPFVPHLSRARFYPGTDVAYASDATNLRLDLADSIQDLQVAIGVDQDGDDTVADNGDAGDEWLFNAAADTPAAAGWNTGRFGYVRVTTLARAERQDPQYQAPEIGRVEDHVYVTAAAAATADPNSEQERMRRRKLARTMIRLRNI